MNIKIEESWKRELADEWEKEYFKRLTEFVRQEYSTKQIFPPGRQIFAAFDSTPFPDVKVVILGQDPYHDVGQANGLCFSVNDGIPFPPSLRNIFKEIESDCGIRMSGYPNLEKWARQGVLMLNSVLTVIASRPASHSRIGWQQFTDSVIRTVSDRREGVVFLLWGNYAKNKAPLIDATRHHILTAAHPSPLAGGAFFGCRHFSRTNEILVSEGLSPIDWQL